MTAGTLHVICGEMFSGKSQELSRLIERESLAEHHTLVILPTHANRHSPRDISRRIPPLPYVTVVEVSEPVNWSTIPIDQIDTIAIDEAQFFGPDLVMIVKEWRRAGKHIIIAGLDLDIYERPFGSMGDFLCLANTITKLHAVCGDCKRQDAAISYRLSEETAQIVVGDRQYVPLCYACYSRRKSQSALYQNRA